MHRAGLTTYGIAIALLVGFATLARADQGFIAGLTPDRRPSGAPVITEFQKDADWYVRALHGISRPYPASLRFLEDQGAWFTPFIWPGMSGPYDLRGWHQPPTGNSSAN